MRKIETDIWWIMNSDHKICRIASLWTWIFRSTVRSETFSFQNVTLYMTYSIAHILRQNMYFSRESYLSKKFQWVRLFCGGRQMRHHLMVMLVRNRRSRWQEQTSQLLILSPFPVRDVSRWISISVINHWCCLFICHLQHLFVMSCLLTSFHHHHCHHYVDHKDAVSWDL